MRLIEKLRKRERQWRRLRWVLLGVSLLAFGCYGYISVSLYNRLHWEALTTEDTFLVAVFWPKILLGMVLGVWFAVWPLTSWHGNTTRLLLLKVLEAQSEKTDDERRG
jgi:hypothetical protein